VVSCNKLAIQNRKELIGALSKCKISPSLIEKKKFPFKLFSRITDENMRSL